MLQRCFMVCLAGVLAQGAAAATLAPCQARNLQLTVGGDGGLNGMSHGGVVLSLRNLGPDCLVPALASVTLLDARGRALPARARAAPDVRPARLHLGGGHHADMTLRWVAGPVYAHNRSVQAARVRLGSGAATWTVNLDARLYGPAGQPVGFERSALRVMEGMAGDL